MKKLIIGMAVVALATASQAVTCEWRLGAKACKIYDQNDTTTVGEQTIYLFDANSAYTASAVLKALSDMSSASAMSKYLSDNSIDSQTLSDGKLTSYNEVSSFGTESSGKWSNYAAVLVSDGDDTYVYFTQNEVTTVPAVESDTAQLGFGSQDASQAAAAEYGTAYAGAGWYTVSSAAVPEPFSGALALLGMGAIALRRKMKKAKKA